LYNDVQGQRSDEEASNLWIFTQNLGATSTTNAWCTKYGRHHWGPLALLTNFGLPARDRRCSCCNFWHCFAREYFPFCTKEERTSRTLRPDRACEQRANVSGSGPKPNYMCTTRPTTVRTCSKREANSYDSTVFKLACTCTLSHTKSISAHHNPQAILTINI
jgi:hypothetical protein